MLENMIGQKELLKLISCTSILCGFAEGSGQFPDSINLLYALQSLDGRLEAAGVIKFNTTAGQTARSVEYLDKNFTLFVNSLAITPDKLLATQAQSEVRQILANKPHKQSFTLPQHDYQEKNYTDEEFKAFSNLLVVAGVNVHSLTLLGKVVNKPAAYNELLSIGTPIIFEQDTADARNKCKQLDRITTECYYTALMREQESSSLTKDEKQLYSGVPEAYPPRPPFKEILMNLRKALDFPALPPPQKQPNYTCT